MLRDLQAEFRAGLLTSEETAPGRLGGAGVIGPERFWIYRNNYVASLKSALEATYPAIARLIGAENFSFLAHAYSRRFPPAEPSLHAYGGGFADHVAGIEAAVGDLPFLPDLARLEWAVNEAYFAADAEPLIAEQLAALAPGDYARLRLALHPTARLVASVYPVWHLWDAEDLANDFPAEGDCMLVLRPGDKVDVILLSPGDHAFLSALADGSLLGEAVEAAVAAEPGFDLTASLAAHLERGTFAGFDLD